MSDAIRRLINETSAKVKADIPAQKEKIKLLRQSLELSAKMGEPQPELLKMLDNMEATIESIEKSLKTPV